MEMSLKEAEKINAEVEARQERERVAAEVAFQARQAEAAERQKKAEAEARARGREQAKRDIEALDATIAAAEDCRIVRLELPWMGDNGPTKIVYPFENLVSALRAYRDRLRQLNAAKKD